MPSSRPRPTALLPLLLLLLACLLPLTAFAQQDDNLEIDIVGGNASALPIAVVPFAGNPGGTDIAAIIRADLARSGQFRVLPERDMVERPGSGAEVRFPTWRMLQQDFLVVGRGGGGFGGGVEYELFDVAKQERLLGFSVHGDNPRDLAHQIADAIYEKILGVRGAFWTRIAYVSQTGVGAGSRYALNVADADGFNPQVVVRSDQPLMSPSWSPDGRRIAYVGFESGNSAIYVQDIASGNREMVTSFRGINGAPSFSPDGNRLAMSLSRDGNPEIYVMDLGSKGLTRITNQIGIDTAPSWSADGASLYFASDRGGRPQVYRVPANGGGASRVTFSGAYNADPAVSYDGKKLVVTQGGGNSYRIALMDGSAGAPRWLPLSPGSMDETPSFAPNASMVAYAAKEGGRGVLYVVSADGRVRERLLAGAGDVREPAWGPYRGR